ncbi:hypothetical protein ROG8370_01763 [Roseovarius gaetbuli]|uniref:YjiS-like domain-containing protein n=1 Tax=Roseovarius gaetbuli TaxID=1356575 RepID=A0A1X6Z6E2_9RHOB|nr:DUF1127 domain-containing protein [Roseovarius gaetbuli]SLN42089.1 hypothetical protein ROG8370_01763 [Roseovarius gaetbuli]
MSLHIHAPARPRTLPRVHFALRDMLAVSKQRNALRHLDDAALADIGLSRREAEREASRPFWDLPTPACR